jgi:rubrerythrin
MSIPLAHRAWEADEDRNHRADQNHDTRGWTPDDIDLLRCPNCGSTDYDTEQQECPVCLIATWPT